MRTIAPVRPSPIAGSWYPDDPAELGAYLDRTLEAAPSWSPPDGDRVQALIAPHAGYPYSGATAAAGYRALRGQAFDRVVLLGPSHHAGFRGVAIGDVDAYATPLGPVALDAAAVERLRGAPLVGTGPAGPDREHSLEIQLPFLQRALAPGWRLVPILVGRLEPEDYGALADAIRPLLDARTLVVVSTDFTHYGARFGYLPFPADPEVAARLEALDKGALAQIEARDPKGFLDYQERTGITICGFRPVALLLHLLPPDTRAHLIRYDTSGAILGDWRSSVSYLSIALTVPKQAAGPLAWQPESLQWLHRLAALRVADAVAPTAASGAALAAHLAGLDHRCNLLFSCLDDKPLEAMAAVLRPLVDRVAVCELADERAMPLLRLREAFPGARVAATPEAALALLPEPVLAAGSLRLVGALLALEEGGAAW